MLGISYTAAIDMWSFGCILVELLTGYPIFPGESEVEQLAYIMEYLGEPPKELLEISTRRKLFFNSDGSPKIVPNSRGKCRYPGTRSLPELPDNSLMNLIQRSLAWDPRERLTPDDAIRHPWIQEGLKLTNTSRVVNVQNDKRQPRDSQSNQTPRGLSMDTKDVS